MDSRERIATHSGRTESIPGCSWRRQWAGFDRPSQTLGVGRAEATPRLHRNSIPPTVPRWTRWCPGFLPGPSIRSTLPPSTYLTLDGALPGVHHLSPDDIVLCSCHDAELGTQLTNWTQGLASMNSSLRQSYTGIRAFATCLGPPVLQSLTCSISAPLQRGRRVLCRFLIS